MTTKKKCLILLPRKIFPLIGGYANYRKNLIEILNRNYQLTVIIISDSKITEDEKKFFETQSYNYQYITISKWKSILGVLRAFFSKLPLQIGYYYFSKVQKNIDKIIGEQNILVGSLIRSMKYFENAPKNCLIINDMADSIALNYKNSESQVSSKRWKFIYKLESDRLLNYEKYWIKKSHITTVFNYQEYNYLKQFGNVKLMPHGVNENIISYNKRNNKFSSSVVFMGKMNYQPNIDAVKWYINNVHINIGEKIPFIIVGAYPTAELINLSKNYPNITVTGFLEDLYEIIQSAMLVVAPMQTGAGIQNKVLEAMALGTINIITTLAANPIIGAENNVHFIIADSSEEFISKITDVSLYPNKYLPLKTASHQFIKNKYTWQSFENQYIKSIEEELKKIFIQN